MFSGLFFREEAGDIWVQEGGNSETVTGLARVMSHVDVIKLRNIVICPRRSLQLVTSSVAIKVSIWIRVGFREDVQSLRLTTFREI